MKNEKLLVCITLLLICFLVFGITLVASNQEKLKVAMVLHGAINDAGWNESAYKGLKLAEEKLGVVIAYSEGVPIPDIEAVMASYASRGYGLVIGHGFEFLDPAKRAAANFPDTQFAVVNGTEGQAPNLSSFRFKTAQTGFIVGMMAGLLTKSNKVGLIAGDKYPHMEIAAKNFKVGAQYVNPECEARSVYVGSWTDIAKGKEMALAMIDTGFDVISGNADQVNLGIIEAAKSRGIKALGYISDQYSIAPDTIFVSVIQSVESMVATIIEKVIKGDLKPEFYELGMEEGVIGLSDFHGNDAKLSSEDRALIKELLTKLVDGTLEKEGILILQN